MDFGRQHLGTTLCFKIILTIVCIFISFYNKASSDKVGNFFFLSWNWHRYLQNKKDKEKMKVSILLDFKSLINYKSSYKPVNRKITVTYGWGEITKNMISKSINFEALISLNFSCLHHFVDNWANSNSNSNVNFFYIFNKPGNGLLEISIKFSIGFLKNHLIVNLIDSSNISLPRIGTFLIDFQLLV